MIIAKILLLPTYPVLSIFSHMKVKQLVKIFTTPHFNSFVQISLHE